MLLSYGRRSNLTLLTVYGFALRDNRDATPSGRLVLEMPVCAADIRLPHLPRIPLPSAAAPQ